jgi:hypothetical protein
MTSQWIVSTHTPPGEIVFNRRGIFSLFNTLNVQGGPLNRALFKNFLDQDRLYQLVCISCPDNGNGGHIFICVFLRSSSWRQGRLFAVWSWLSTAARVLKTSPGAVVASRRTTGSFAAVSAATAETFLQNTRICGDGGGRSEQGGEGACRTAGRHHRSWVGL